MKTMLFSIAALAALASAPAQATEILTQTVNISADAPTAGKAISFAQFDASLGELQSVTLSFASTLIANLSLSNVAATSKTVTLTTGGTAAISGNGFNFVDVLGSGSLHKVVPGKTKLDIAPFAAASTEEDTIFNGFAPFLGAGDVNFTFKSTSLFALSPSSVTFSGVPLIGAAATLTYEYDAASVPEVGSWLLMLAGFGTVGLIMRRRRTSLTFA